MNKQINKTIFFMYVSMIIALLLGVYGQDISYFIADNILDLSPIYYLTTITIISIFLFIMPYIIVLKLEKKQKIEGKKMDLFFSINTLIGAMTSLWALFVLIMWWG